MRRISLVIIPFLLSFVAIIGVSLADKVKTNTTPIEHVIVLMLENRSFDHMLGFLKKSRAEIEGCLPDNVQCKNPINPQDPSSPEVVVDDNAIYVQVSPSHSISGTTQQLYGSSVADISKPAPMNGFITSYTSVTGATSEGSTVMRCFNESTLPILSTLANEFALFDGWHASIPGPTMPNRAYAASATSHGMGTNDEVTIAKGMPQKSMFRQLEEMGLDYRVYFELVPAVMMLKDLRHRDARPRFHGMRQFYTDVANGDLPEFTWLEPRFYNTPNYPADDQHPDHDVGEGERLVKNIYEALRASSLWNSSALVITYDEHGGFFDHVPPSPVIPSPDDFDYVDEQGNTLFDFTRLGVRIPTLVVSPLVPKGSIIHAAPEGQGQYEHSSVIATVVHKLFRPQVGRPKQDFLNKRDAWAATFESVFSLRKARTDCPETLPDVVLQRKLLHSDANASGIRLAARDGSDRINDLQLELLYVVAGVTDDASFDSSEAVKWTEVQAAQYAADKLNNYFGRQVVVI